MCQVWGWQDCKAQGDRIGWVDGGALYLDRDATYRALSTAAREAGESLPSQRALWALLKDRHVLVETDTKRV